MVLEGRLTFLHAVPPATPVGCVGHDASQPVHQAKQNMLK